MSSRRLQELAKFASGLVLGDFLVGLWLYASNMLPIDFWGFHITPEGAIVWMIFDIILILLLMHYAWRIEFPSPSIRQKSFYLFVGIVFGIVAILHAVRLIFGIEAQIGGWAVPMGLSWVGTIVAGYLSYAAFKFTRHK